MSESLENSEFDGLQTLTLKIAEEIIQNLTMFGSYAKVERFESIDDDAAKILSKYTSSLSTRPTK